MLYGPALDRKPLNIQDIYEYDKHHNNSRMDSISNWQFIVNTTCAMVL